MPAAFTQVFGGGTIFPSQASYRAFALTSDLALTWPVEVATDSNIVANIMDVTPNQAGWDLRMPPANQASPGEATLIFNVGSFAFTVTDAGGNTIVSVDPGEAWQVYLKTNATTNGTWGSVAYGAGTSSATAGSLVGAGIKAIGATLNQSMEVTTISTDYTPQAPDRAAAFLWDSGAGTISLPSAATLGNDWFFHLRNGGTGAITVETTVGGQEINGAATLLFNPGDSGIIVCDGTNFFTVGFGQAAEFAFDYVSIDLTSETSPYVLSGAELNRIAYSFGGTLTGNMEVVVPNTVQQYWPGNDTDLASDPYTITVKTSAGSGVALSRGARAIVYCDGTNVIDADTSTISFPVTIAQGGTGAVTPSGARTNLGATSVGNAVFTAANAGAGRAAISAAALGANSDITSLSGLTTPLSVAQGGSGAATLTGVLKGNGTGAFTAATAGTDYAKPDTASTWTAKQTLSGGAATLAAKLANALEAVTISATAATGTINYDITTQSVLYYTTNASANWTVNLRGNGSNTLNSLMATGESVTVVFMVTQGGTAYYNSAVQVDGTAVGVTTKWLNGAPSSGTINSIAVYSYTVIKTGASTFTVIASIASAL
jgi:hypothetical protein